MSLPVVPIDETYEESATNPSKPVPSGYDTELARVTGAHVLGRIVRREVTPGLNL